MKIPSQPQKWMKWTPRKSGLPLPQRCGCYSLLQGTVTATTRAARELTGEEAIPRSTQGRGGRRMQGEPLSGRKK